VEIAYKVTLHPYLQQSQPSKFHPSKLPPQGKQVFTPVSWPSFRTFFTFSFFLDSTSTLNETHRGTLH
jgi:hypothetical protein